MAGFITEITNVLGIELVLGTLTMTLGGIALGTILLGAGVAFAKKAGGRR